MEAPTAPDPKQDPGTQNRIGSERMYRLVCEAEGCDLDRTLPESEHPRRKQWDHSQYEGHQAVLRRVGRGDA